MYTEIYNKNIPTSLCTRVNVLNVIKDSTSSYIE